VIAVGVIVASVLSHRSQVEKEKAERAVFLAG
jgi:putrescine transport system permease protein